MVSATTTSNVPWIYQDGPSRMQVEGEPRYAKTRENYGYYLHNGIMLQLESLETFPAPVLCPSCEKPIITALENERSMNDKINIGLGTLMSCGLCLYMVKNYHRSFVHRCPSCETRLVRLDRDLSQAYVARVLVRYRSETGALASGRITTVHLHGGGIHYQWNNHNSKIGTQAGEIDIQNQNNEYESTTHT